VYPQIFGKYVLEGEIARGGMARLVLATLRGAGGFEKKLVVKQIRDELASDEGFVKRFVQEAKTTVALSHPNIVPVYELGVEQGTYFLAMELVVGVSVAELLGIGGAAPDPNGPPLTPEQGAYVGVEVCRALDYAHRRMRVVHGDITPRNVMVDEEGQVKLIDFGIALPFQSHDAGAKPIEVFGSPGHMPPEQMEGKSIGPAADVFALGTLLMEVWSKKAPFRRKTAEEVEAAMRAPGPKPSDVDPRLLPLDDVIGRALANDAKDRPQDVDELGRALRKFLSGADAGDVAREIGARVRERRAVLREKKEAPPSSSGAGGLQRPPSRGEMVTKTFAARPEALTTGPSTRKLPTSDAPPEKVETIATRPIETPTSPQPRRSSNLRVAGAVALVAAAAGAAYWLRGRPPPPPPPPPPAPTVTATASATATATASATEPKPSGHLALYGDPGTRALVDGASKGRCPLPDVTVEPGPHDVRFVFDATGESSGTRLTVNPGEHVKIRADFTGATPTVRVQR
jgi:serine/threonine protein kinase